MSKAQAKKSKKISEDSESTLSEPMELMCKWLTNKKPTCIPLVRMTKQGRYKNESSFCKNLLQINRIKN